MGRAQSKRTLKNSVSYVAASVVYINAGREGHLAVGDTVKIYRGPSEIGSVLITAVSKRSSSAQILQQTVSITMGDDAVIEKELPDEQPVVTVVQISQKDSAEVPASDRSSELSVSSTENIVSGRVSLQYIGTIAEDSRLNLNQPSGVLRLNIQNL